MTNLIIIAIVSLLGMFGCCIAADRTNTWKSEALHIACVVTAIGAGIIAGVAIISLLFMLIVEGAS